MCEIFRKKYNYSSLYFQYLLMSRQVQCQNSYCSDTENSFFKLLNLKIFRAKDNISSPWNFLVRVFISCSMVYGFLVADVSWFWILSEVNRISLGRPLSTKGVRKFPNFSWDLTGLSKAWSFFSVYHIIKLSQLPFFPLQHFPL